MRHLNLWKQHLGIVPESVWAETNLETLVLADNDLTEVSEEIGRLTNLRMLDLGHNQLAAIGNLRSRFRLPMDSGSAVS